jgi:1-acyl-sn-glycerol-3-phosphate acyltransferase
MFRYLPRTVDRAHDASPPAVPIERRAIIRIAQGINRLFARNYHDMSVLAPAELPRTGPAILVSNHVSGLDPLLIQSACSRLVIWMMAREYYDIRSIGWIFRMVGAIPVERSGRDTAATRAALRALNDGRVVGIFPEGRIETDHELLPFQTGVALLAIKTGVPVYPVYLDGTQRGKNMLSAVLHPHRVRIAFGPAVSFDRDSTSKPALEAATDAIKKAVLALRSKSGGNTI